ncbi:hypothetical protein Cni_G14737 [Canna indica]|uniref:Transmembrane protein n=1 Tax=Canna indica TaxID=4628 RepID=A0AAQ3KES6_9LILI|nr:hypothetical protein Cni_G14737 [Canna indica]
MAAEESPATKAKGNRRQSCLLSCFGAPPTVKPRWWMFGEKKKTVVPVVDALPIREEEAPTYPPEEKPKSMKRSGAAFLHWFHKKGKRIRDPISTNSTQDQPQHPTTAARNTSRSENSLVRQFMSKSKTRSEPAPLYRVHDQVPTGTQIIHPSSPELNRHATLARTSGASLHKKPTASTETFDGVGEFSSTVGLSVIAVVLGLMLFCGQMGTVICICTWLYFLPRIRAASKMNRTGSDRKGDEKIDINSREYKKMVVLKGLLERDGRRPSSSKLADVH